MLQWIRDKSQGAIAIIIVVILCLAFGLWGIHNYMRGSQHKTVVAKVNGHEITKRELAQSFAHFRAQNIQKHPEWFNSQQAVQKSRQRVLHHLVERYLLVQTANQYGLRVGDDLLQQMLANIPIFQKDGVFSKQRFQRFLASMRMDQQSFIQMMRDQMLKNQMKLGIVNSSFITPHELMQTKRLVEQKRSFYYTIVPYQPLLSTKHITKQQMHHYYSHHQQAYRVPKQLQLAYIKLNKKQLKQSIKPTNKQLKSYYNNNLDQFAQPEQWHVSYLALSQDNKSTKAKKLYQHWRQGAHPDSLAQQYSGVDFHKDKVIKAQDKQQGPWQSALQGHQQVGEVLSPFKTEHAKVIAKIKSHQPATAPGFKSIKDQVRKAYIKSEINKDFSDKVNKLANLTFEHSTSLQPAAQELDLKVHTTPYFKESADHLNKGILQYDKVRKAAFSDEVAKAHNNSDVINLDDGTVVVIRAHNIKPEHIKAFEKVEDQIKQQVAKQQASGKAYKIAQQWRDQIDSEHSLKELAKQDQGISVETLKSVQRQDIKAASSDKSYIIRSGFHLPRPTKEHPSSTIKVLPNGDVAVVQLTSVEQPSVSPNDITKKHKQSIQRGYGALEYQLYKQAVKSQASIDYNS